MLVAPNVFVPTPETVGMVDVPAKYKVAPLETLKFLAEVSATAYPPLLRAPDCIDKLPVTFVDAMAALKEAPVEYVLFTVRLLYVTALTPIGMLCEIVLLLKFTVPVDGVNVPK